MANFSSSPSSSSPSFRPRRAFPTPFPTQYEVSDHLPNTNQHHTNISQETLAERRQKRELRSRPWLTNSVSKQTSSTSQSAPERRVVLKAAPSKGKEKVVPTANSPRLVEVRARASKFFAGYNREAAYASGCRLPRLVSKTAARAATKTSVVEKEIAAVAGGEKEQKLSPVSPVVQEEANGPVSDTSSDAMD